jgi:hypothetical protein
MIIAVVDHANSAINCVMNSAGVAFRTMWSDRNARNASRFLGLGGFGQIPSAKPIVHSPAISQGKDRAASSQTDFMENVS